MIAGNDCIVQILHFKNLCCTDCILQPPLKHDAAATNPLEENDEIPFCTFEEPQEGHSVDCASTFFCSCPKRWPHFMQ